MTYTSLAPLYHQLPSRFVITAMALIFISLTTFSSSRVIAAEGQLDSMSPSHPFINGDFTQVKLPEKTRGDNLKDCVSQLNKQGLGWCEIIANDQHPSISSVWPKNLDDKTSMVTGPASILIAWNSAAFDKEKRILYFWGGGHADYGGNEVYRFDLNIGKWKRLTNPSPLNHLFVMSDYNWRPDQPWRRLCWMPNVNKIPASAHSYDGLIFSHKTKTIFLYAMRPANGSCIEDKTDAYKKNSIVHNHREMMRGWY